MLQLAIRIPLKLEICIFTMQWGIYHLVCFRQQYGSLAGVTVKVAFLPRFPDPELLQTSDF